MKTIKGKAIDMNDKILFDLPNSGKRCRDCKHIANLNKWSDRYWYCTITPSNRTLFKVKAVKRMCPACDRFESNKEKP